MDSTEDTWDRLWQVNLKGQIICCKAVLAAHMIPNQRGRIVNIGSDAGRVGSSGEAVYSATKGGVIAFTKTLAREMARHQVTVNCVCPGPTDTALLAQLGEDKTSGLRASLTKAIPLRREAAARRHRRRRRLPVLRRRRLHDRPDRVGQRRPHHGLSGATARTVGPCGRVPVRAVPAGAVGAARLCRPGRGGRHRPAHGRRPRQLPRRPGLRRPPAGGASWPGWRPTIGVQTGVYLLALRHPVPAARQIATVANLAPGRLHARRRPRR